MKKYYVGKPKRKKAIIVMMIYLAFDLFCLYGYLNPVEQIHQYTGMKMCLLIIIIGLFVITFLLIGPMLYSTSLWWSVDDEKLEYCNYPHYVSRLKAFYLPKYSQHYFISLSTKEIESITLLWQKIPRGMFIIYSYPIYFHIEMIDGTELYLKGLIGRKSNDFIRAAYFMKSQNIQWHDPYHLLEIIEDPHLSVGQYIDDIVKKRSSS